MDKYLVRKLVGQGSFGRALLCERIVDKHKCIVKEISLKRMSKKEADQTEQEGAILARLNHPNITTFWETFVIRDNLYIVMEYCDAGDLALFIKKREGKLLMENQVLHIFVQISLAIKHVHDRKILHRDLKTQNIFLTTAGVVKLGDFGIARVLHATGELASTRIGTPYYMSPEVMDNKKYNNKTDIWSLGCILYELMALKVPFDGQSMRTLIYAIMYAQPLPLPYPFSFDLRDLCKEMLVKSPRLRPSITGVLCKPVIRQRICAILTPKDVKNEFSHTVLLGENIMRPCSGSSEPLQKESKPGSDDNNIRMACKAPVPSVMVMKPSSGISAANCIVKTPASSPVSSPGVIANKSPVSIAGVAKSPSSNDKRGSPAVVSPSVGSPSPAGTPYAVHRPPRPFKDNIQAPERISKCRSPELCNLNQLIDKQIKEQEALKEKISCIRKGAKFYPLPAKKQPSGLNAKAIDSLELNAFRANKEKWVDKVTNQMKAIDSQVSLLKEKFHPNVIKPDGKHSEVIVNTEASKAIISVVMSKVEKRTEERLKLKDIMQKNKQSVKDRSLKLLVGKSGILGRMKGYECWEGNDDMKDTVSSENVDSLNTSEYFIPECESRSDDLKCFVTCIEPVKKDHPADEVICIVDDEEFFEDSIDNLCSVVVNDTDDLIGVESSTLPVDVEDIDIEVDGYLKKDASGKDIAYDIFTPNDMDAKMDVQEVQSSLISLFGAIRCEKVVQVLLNLDDADDDDVVLQKIEEIIGLKGLPYLSSFFKVASA